MHLSPAMRPTRAIHVLRTRCALRPKVASAGQIEPPIVDNAGHEESPVERKRSQSGCPRPSALA
jgi:hypothetical protein